MYFKTDLKEIKEAALALYKATSGSKFEESEDLLAYCYSQATINFLVKKGHDSLVGLEYHSPRFTTVDNKINTGE